MSIGRRTLIIAAGILVFGFFLGTRVDLWTDSAASPADSQDKILDQGNFHSIFSVVAEKVRPAVVYIKTEKSIDSGSGREFFGPFEFFRDFIPNDERHYKIPGGGSGFIIDKKGRILTNYHVIEGTEKITVVLGDELDEKEFEAEIVGYDKHTDIAIIKIDTDLDLPVVKLGDSDECKVGDWVMAIGTPFGQLAGTATVGIVSAKGRSDLRIAGGGPDYQNFIQTDASINFGNSGGPLVNIRGEAIGINAAINPSGQGIGFAIPINMVKGVMNQLIEKGRVQYGYIGIILLPLDKTLAEGLGLKVDRGVMVKEVLPGTPAEEAGLKSKDVIIEFNGKPVKELQKFRIMVANTPVGSKVPIVVLRKNKKKKLSIRIMERPEEPTVAAVKPKGKAWLGIHVRDIDSPEVRQHFNLKKVHEGVVAVDVDKDSPAGEAGIRPGDVITEVYSHKVSNMKDYNLIAEKLKNRKDPIAFLIKRKGFSKYIPVIPEKD
jgi:serine protease Do